jgi:replication factor A1
MPLVELEKQMPGVAIDVIGIIVEVGAASNMTLKSGINRDRRTITIADESDLKVQITMWGSIANNIAYEKGQVLAVKNAKVSDFGGKSLNCGDESSYVTICPPHPRSDKLIQWY